MDDEHDEGGQSDDRGAVDRASDERARENRLRQTVDARLDGVGANLRNRPFDEHPSNDDPTLGPVGSFTKGLPHGESGEVPTETYREFAAALRAEAYETVRGLAANRPFVNPGAAASTTITGRDPNEVGIDAAPRLFGDRTAAETVELYWQALLRDLEFGAYDAESIRKELPDGIDGGDAPVTAELTRLVESVEGFTLPTEQGAVTPGTLFRGMLPGATTGPYVSQFLYQPIPRGARLRDQRLRVFEPDRDFMKTFDDWLAVQNGETGPDTIDRVAPGGPPFAAGDPDPSLGPDDGLGLAGPVDTQPRTDERRLITTGRDLATYARANTSQQPYLGAALILQGLGAPLDPGAPFGDSVPASFVDYGRTEYQTAVVDVVHAGLHAAWYHKWLVHRRPRPEEYGGVVERVTARDADYPVPDLLRESTALEAIGAEFDTALLPQAYVDGSPTHPSYPAGHAVSAGACTTVLKALFDTTTTFAELAARTDGRRGEKLLPRPDGEGGHELVPVSELDGNPQGIRADLTVGGELNKLATNVALGRNWGGIHYRTDATAGYRLGEAIAVAYLEDRLRTRDERTQLRLPTFDGETVTLGP